jgi:transcription elongation factor Elf1
MSAANLPAIRAVAEAFRKAPVHVKWSQSDILARLDAAIDDDSPLAQPESRRKQAYATYLPCPKCGNKRAAVTGGDQRSGGHFVRRHKCGDCGHAYKTETRYYIGNEPMAGPVDKAGFGQASGCEVCGYSPCACDENKHDPERPV